MSKKTASRAGRPAGPADKDLESVLNEVSAQPQNEHLEEWLQVVCPYCDESFEVHVSSDKDGQTFYEDCEMCSRSVALHVRVEEGELQVDSHRS